MADATAARIVKADAATAIHAARSGLGDFFTADIEAKLMNDPAAYTDSRIPLVKEAALAQLALKDSEAGRPAVGELADRLETIKVTVAAQRAEMEKEISEAQKSLMLQLDQRFAVLQASLPNTIVNTICRH